MDGSIMEPNMYMIQGMAILDNDGNRVLAKYYKMPNGASVLPTLKEQKAFEKKLFAKTHRANAEIIMLDGLTVVYKSNVDLFFYVMGKPNENEVILSSVLQCLFDSLNTLLRKNVEKKSLLDCMEIAQLAFDEVVDNGIILEADPNALSQRLTLRSDDIPLGEQTVAQVFQSAKDQIKWSLLK